VSAAEYPRDRLDALFAAIDANDGEAFAKFLTPDASFRFGSAPAAVGRDAIVAGVEGFFATIAGCSHRIDKVIGRGDSLLCEGWVTYRRHDQTEVAVPFADVFELRGDLISEYKIYMDIAPLFRTQAA
jgi:limonene-1,2-epoxide hydrolase